MVAKQTKWAKAAWPGTKAVASHAQAKHGNSSWHELWRVLPSAHPLRGGTRISQNLELNLTDYLKKIN